MARPVMERVELLHAQFRSHRQRWVRANGLTAAQYTALACLAGQFDAGGGELARLAGVRPQTMQRTLACLERKRLIERPGPVGPGYARRASVTRRGKVIVERCRAAFLELEHLMLARFTPDLADTFDQCLEECSLQLQKLPRDRASGRTPISGAGADRSGSRAMCEHQESCEICKLLRSA